MNDAGAEDVQRFADRLVGEVERAVTGKRQSIRLLVMALLADGHVLIEDLARRARGTPQP